ncbi:MAG: hypothetical protein ABSE73_24040 [Planctomycetota bacterium]
MKQNPSAFLLFFSGAVLALLAARAPRAGEAPETAKSPPGGGPGTGGLESFEDKEAGYSMRIPAGYKLFTADQNRAVVKTINEFGGKEVNERVQRFPPARFGGPVDPAKPKALPPSLEVLCTGPLSIDPAQKAQYQQMLEEDYRKTGLRHGDITLKFIQVSGVNALQAEHDMYSPMDNSRNRLIRVLVPAPDRSFDIIFNFSPHQQEGVEEALQVVLNSFKITEWRMLDSDAQTKWGRVALFTVVGFVTGIVLAYVLKLLAGAVRKPQGK